MEQSKEVQRFWHEDILYVIGESCASRKKIKSRSSGRRGGGGKETKRRASSRAERGYQVCSRGRNCIGSRVVAFSGGIRAGGPRRVGCPRRSRDAAGRTASLT